MGRRENPDLENLANILNEVIIKKIKTQEKMKLEGDASIERNDIVDYDGFMKVAALDKFNNPGYVYGANLYATEKDLQAKKPLGALILYFAELQDEIITFLKNFGYKGFDDEDYNEVANQIKSFSDEITKEYIAAVAAQGFITMVPGESMASRNSLFPGVSFCLDQYQKYQIEYNISHYKRLVAELTLTIVPKA